MMILGIAAIIVTGGTHGSKSAELLHGNGSYWCSLPDLPEVRYGHTQTGLEACGSFRAATTKTTCVRLSGGSWSPSHNLQQDRKYHSSWASPSGTVLMGGSYGSQTTELLDQTTEDSVMHFPLEYDTWYVNTARAR